MAKRIQLRRGTTVQTNAFTGALGEVTVDTDKDVLVVHDAVTVGGFAVAARANADGGVSLINKTGVVLATVPATGLLNNTLTSTATDQAVTAAQAKVLKDLVDTKLAANGTAPTATKLATARKINNVDFDGTLNITVADATKLPLAGGALTGNLTSTGTVKVNNTTASTSATTGALTTTGGLGVVGAAWITGAITSAGIIKTTNATASTSATTGSAVFAGGLGVGGAMFITGGITSAANITAYSDIRLKDNIEYVNNAVAKVTQLNGITYTRKDQEDQTTRYVGLVAQEVQAVLPEAIKVLEDEQQTLTVDYQGLVGVLVEAIKELNIRIENLEGK